jgi:hypothetical protein
MRYLIYIIMINQGLMTIALYFHLKTVEVGVDEVKEIVVKTCSWLKE